LLDTEPIKYSVSNVYVLGLTRCNYNALPGRHWSLQISTAIFT